MPPPRPHSGPAWPLTTGVSETYWAWPGLEMVVNDEGGEVPLTALAAACSARKRATWVSSPPSGTRAQAIAPLTWTVPFACMFACCSKPVRCGVVVACVVLAWRESSLVMMVELDWNYNTAKREVGEVRILGRSTTRDQSPRTMHDHRVFQHPIYHGDEVCLKVNW